MSLSHWNLLTDAELAMMFQSGMLPFDIPAGFNNRRERIRAAKIVQLRDDRRIANDNLKIVAADLSQNFDSVTKFNREKKAKRERCAA